MPRGEKFNAAEKHFMNKEEKYRKEINALSSKLREIVHESNVLKRTNDDQEKKIKMLEEQLIEQNKLISMSPEELDKHVKAIKGMQMLTMNFFGNQRY